MCASIGDCVNYNIVYSDAVISVPECQPISYITHMHAYMHTHTQKTTQQTQTEAHTFELHPARSIAHEYAVIQFTVCTVGTYAILFVITCDAARLSFSSVCGTIVLCVGGLVFEFTYVSRTPRICQVLNSAQFFTNVRAGELLATARARPNCSSDGVGVFSAIVLNSLSTASQKRASV